MPGRLWTVTATESRGHRHPGTSDDRTEDRYVLSWGAIAIQLAGSGIGRTRNRFIGRWPVSKVSAIEFLSSLLQALHAAIETAGATVGVYQWISVRINGWSRTEPAEVVQGTIGDLATIPD